MTHYFAYWRPSTVVANYDSPDLDHAASNQFGRVRAGDVLWFVTSEGPNDLVLIGRMKVAKVVGQREAERITGQKELWQSDYHVFPDVPEPKIYLDLSRLVHRISFDGIADCLPEGFTGRNLQTMRRLDFDTEQFMERLWTKRNDLEDQSE